MDVETKKILEQHGKQIDLIATKVVEHDERLDRIENKMVTKDDHQEVMNTLDKLVGLAERKDQEITVMAHQMKEMGDQVEENTKDIKEIRPAVGLT
jgi:methyl-accepting chemotaxis protein